ncbi:MAG TPA: hypothetical protein VGO62_09135 [Myxococcota bacterium]|jgi:hypothetical protein
MDAEQAALVDQVRGLPADRAFRVYTELLEKSAGHAQLAALALRDKARAGELKEDHLPVLEACLLTAPDSACVVHFAKALAAFGRKAQASAAILIEKTREIRVTDDVQYWILDGCLFALGFLGGPDVLGFVAELAVERPSRAIRAHAVYTGEMTRDQREERFRQALIRVHDLVAQADAGTWRDKRTTLVAKPVPSSNAPSKKSWNLR